MFGVSFFLLIGFVFGWYFATDKIIWQSFAVPITESTKGGFFYQYQTFISAVIALIVGFATIKAMNNQTEKNLRHLRTEKEQKEQAIIFLIIDEVKLFESSVLSCQIQVLDQIIELNGNTSNLFPLDKSAKLHSLNTLYDPAILLTLDAEQNALVSMIKSSTESIYHIYSNINSKNIGVDEYFDDINNQLKELAKYSGTYEEFY